MLLTKLRASEPHYHGVHIIVAYYCRWVVFTTQRDRAIVGQTIHFGTKNWEDKADRASGPDVPRPYQCTYKYILDRYRDPSSDPPARPDSGMQWVVPLEAR